MRTFEDLLKKHFALENKLHSELDPIKDESWDVKDYFTDEGWEAWGRYIELVEDMAKIGLLDERGKDYLIEKVWDIVWNP